MIRILLHIVFFIPFAIDYTICFLKMLFLLPKVVFNEVWRSFRFYLTKLPHKIRKYFPYYDSRGLKHNADYLKSINISEMIQWTWEDQAEFADQVAVNICKNKVEVVAIEFVDLKYSEINATSIGNIAYLILNHPSMEFREKAYKEFNKVEQIIKDHNKNK